MYINIQIDISFKHILQKLFRGFSDTELWDIGDALYVWLYPRLKAFRKMRRRGFPAGYTKRSWEEFLAKSQRALEIYLWVNTHKGFKTPLKYDYHQVEADCKKLLANVDLLWE